jgi:hypothetical protein
LFFFFVLSTSSTSTVSMNLNSSSLLRLTCMVQLFLCDRFQNCGAPLWGWGALLVLWGAVIF